MSSSESTAGGTVLTADSAGSDYVLSVEGLRTYFDTEEGEVRAVDGVDLKVRRGKTLCVVGESGCGKSITARSILGLIDEPGRIDGGHVWWQPKDGEESLDLAALDPKGPAMRKVRGAQIGMVFQEPMASLSPMYTVGAQLVQAIRLHQPNLSKGAARQKAIEQLGRVGIPQPDRRFDSYSFQLSGGMCQRVMIAIALANEPDLLIADEPSTALDVTTQARILDLIRDLQAELNMSVLFITHDLGVVAEIADDVSVMYLGKVVEQGTVTDIFESPGHPYTRALLSSIPGVASNTAAAEAQGRGQHQPDSPLSPGRRRRLATIGGTVPSPLNRPSGCFFHTRCPSFMAGLCEVERPEQIPLDGDHSAACFLHDERADVYQRAASHFDVQDAGHSAAGGSAEESDSAPGDAHRATEAAPAVVQGEEKSAEEPSAAVSPPPARETSAQASLEKPLLSVRDLQMHFPVKKGFFGRVTGHVRAVDGVDLDIYPGETLGLVGESGCGKTTLGRSIARASQPTAGQVHYRDPDAADSVDLASMGAGELRHYREQIRVIFQDPFSSLNPRKNLLQIVADPLRQIHGERFADSSVRDRVADMLTRVGLRADDMFRYPHTFSGGQRQRINIARALITNPRLVIADEAVSALDVSVRAQILNLLAGLQEEYDLTYLFISHDLSVVEHISDRVAVMYLGKIVEQAKTADLYRAPQHPYSEALLSAVPIPDPRLRDRGSRIRLSDDLPDPTDPPAGCYFHTRCPYMEPGKCDVDSPQLRDIKIGASGSTSAEAAEDEHLAACHFSESLDLAGVTDNDAAQHPSS